MFRARPQFQIYFAVLALGAIIAALLLYGFSSWWLLSLALHFLIFTFGLAFGYHRTLTHGAVDAYLLPKRAAAFVGTLAWLGSPQIWIAKDQAHHQDVEGLLDSDARRSNSAPGPTAETTFASLQLDFSRPPTEEPQDSFLEFLHKFYLLILATDLVLVTLLAGVKGLLFLGLIPSGISLFSGMLTNFLSHKRWGYRNFETADRSKNLWWLWFLTFGENWHNNHHFHPQSKTTKVKWWEIDIVALYCFLFDRGTYTKLRIFTKRFLMRFRWRKAKDYVYFKPSA